jgi:hypothetical protein
MVGGSVSDPDPHSASSWIRIQKKENPVSKFLKMKTDELEN